MPVSHARAAVVTSTDGKEAGKVPGLLGVAEDERRWYPRVLA